MSRTTSRASTSSRKAPSALPASSSRVRASPIGPWLCAKSSCDTAVSTAASTPRLTSAYSTTRSSQRANALTGSCPASKGRRGGHELVNIVSVDLGEQRLAGREVPVEGALPYSGTFGDRVEAHVVGLREGSPGDLDDPSPVRGRIRAERDHRGHWQRITQQHCDSEIGADRR